MRRTVHGFTILAFALVSTVARADDVQIAQQIASQLRTQKQAQQLKGFHIGIKVEGGHVSMKGQVSSQQQRDLALNVARRVPGVKLVINELQVTPAGTHLPTAGTSTGQVTNSLRQPSSAKQALTANTADVAASTWASMGAGVAPALAQPGSISTGTLPQPVQAEARQINWTTPAVTGSGVVQQPVAQSRVPSLQVQQDAQTQAQLLAARQAQLVQFQQAQLAARQAAQLQASAAHAQQAGPQGQQPVSSSQPVAQMANVPNGASYGMTAGAITPSVASGTPVPISGGTGGVPIEYTSGGSGYDQASVPGSAWPSYAAYPNYAGVTYPRQYSPTAWPYIGPFYPYPQVPLGWRKVTLEWDDGWWWLDFCAK